PQVRPPRPWGPGGDGADGRPMVEAAPAGLIVAQLDRHAILDSLTRAIGEAWESFDRPRPREPELTPELEERLSTPLPEDPGDVDAALDDAAHVLDASVSPSRPLYLAYVGSTGLAIGIGGGAPPRPLPGKQ